MFGGCHELLRCKHRPRASHRRVSARAVQGRGAGHKRHSVGAAHRRRGAGRADQTLPIAASCCAACRTKSRARPDTSRPTGSTCSSFTPAAATPPCRRWSAARLITPPPRSTLPRSEEHTSELQSLRHLVCRLLLEKKKD